MPMTRKAGRAKGLLKKGGAAVTERLKAGKASLEQAARVVEELKKDSLYESIAGFMEKILRFHLDVKETARGKIDASDVFPKDIPSRLEGGELMADLTKLKVDAPFMRQALMELCAIVKERADGKPGGIEEILAALHAGKVDFQRLQGAVVGRDEYIALLHREINAAPEMIFSLAMSAYRPVFEAALESGAAKHDDAKWGRGNCPACGAFPAMARLEKETGKRRLWCSTCNSEWSHKRLKCPFCGNDDPERLEYFYLEDGSPYRVDVCRDCKGYLKTIDENKGDLGGILFMAEDIKTSYLDLLAEKEGFKKPTQGGQQ